jgi:hypothetical protein
MFIIFAPRRIVIAPYEGPRLQNEMPHLEVVLQLNKERP